MGFLGLGGQNKDKKKLITGSANNLSGLGSKAQSWADQDRARNESNAGRVSSSYWDLYNGIGAGGADGSGGAGGGAVETYSNPFWEQMMKGEQDQFNPIQHGLGGVYDKMVSDKGLFGESGYNDVMRQSAANNAAQFAGMKRGLNQSGAIRGGAGPGFSLQNLALASTGARAGNQAALDSRLGLMDRIHAQNIEGGKLGAAGAESALNLRATGAREYDSQQEKAIAARNAAAARGAGAADDAFRNKMAILGELRGLRGESGSENALLGLAGQNYGNSGAMAGTLPQEKSWLSSIAGAAIPLATTAMTGGFGGLGGIAKKAAGVAAPAPGGAFSTAPIKPGGWFK